MMTSTHVATAKEVGLFFKRAVKNPKQLGSFIPSSKYLGALMAKHAALDNHSPIVELGGGTGALTRAMINAGVQPERLYVIELYSELADYLRSTLPNVNVIEGDASDLLKVLPKEIIGNIPTVVSGLPMINIPAPAQKAIIESCFQVMKPQGTIVQYTYAPVSSINVKKLNLQKKRLGTVWRNVPPATVWQYKKA